MSTRTRARRWLIAALIIALASPALVLRPRAQTPGAPTPDRLAGVPPERRLKPGLPRDKQAREAWLLHELNRQRLARTHPLGELALTAGLVSTDVDDITVLQGGNTSIPPTPFDLNAQAVQFTPAAGGYTANVAAQTFDNNLGAKIDLTAAPAVNPKVGVFDGVELGDDAYLTQDLGFNFDFYGTSYASVAVSSNGCLTFRPAGVSDDDFNFSTVDATETLFVLQTEVPRIAPYWHDLDATARRTQGATGIYFRRETDRVMVTWNGIRDFPNDPTVDNGIHRFQATLFRDGRILFAYDSAQLRTTAIVGLSPGNAAQVPTFVDLSASTSGPVTGPLAEFFSRTTQVDVISVAQAFYATHPDRDVYDFIYVITDFEFNLGSVGTFAFYQSFRNDAAGIGLVQFDSDPEGRIGGRRIQGILNLSNIDEDYPELPTTRFLGANNALSIMAQEQGHRWLSYVGYTGVNPRLLLGRDDAHWSFFLNIESTLSHPAARRSSSMEGNVWRENGDGTFTSVNLIDGYSRLDQYLMGLRPAAEVPETFVINGRGGGVDRESAPEPNVTINGTKQAVTINQIVQANEARTPDAAAAQKNFRAAVALIIREGAPPAPALLNKVMRYRLAWESYFAQSTDYLAGINTGLADAAVSRVVAAASAASFQPALAPGEIGALFGAGLTAGGTESAASQPLPTQLAGTQVVIDGTPAPLFFASPGQINFQVPRTTAAATLFPSVPSATAFVEVFSNGQLIRAGTFQIAPVVPAIFTLNLSGAGPAAAADALTGAGAPFNARQASGEPNIIAVFGTGLGADATDVGGDVTSSVQATIDGAPATVLYAGAAPGFTGLNQLNLALPAGIAAGNHTLVVSRNGIAGNAVTIAIR